MPSLRTTLVAALTACSTATASLINDFSCKSDSHPNPVILLHGLGATGYEDINVLQYWLQAKDYCTFARTYGAYDGFPFLGGLKPIAESASEIAKYIQEVAEKTGADKVDVVGHSEGALQTLYVPKFHSEVVPLIDKLVAIAPPTRGTNFAGLYQLAIDLGNNTKSVVDKALDTVGCQACSELVTGGEAIKKLNDGEPIVQEGNSLTVIASKHDELVTPVETSFVHEEGVSNVWVQDKCRFDVVGHIGEAYDPNVWNLVKNALDDTPERDFICVVGSPLK
ncbi:esterase/lipase family protein [Aspergillus ruber CBS 135680]|uniref:Lipase n=1 Tax=Aspergillus ruber (strain CBS 135680) TaxID=1388766 RepID=A0A017S4Z3_ASPRC|nr:lipase [Aspergillus ruber CBS 135680]EYE91921.1 lipase [Aspergillus ruber CBS 135680]